MLAIIPFSGFYDSWHDDELDNGLEQALSDLSGNPNSSLCSRAFDHIDWLTAHTEYAKVYTEAFADEFEIKLKFESLNSPREYNFTTDRIFVTMSQKEMRRVVNRTRPEYMDAVCKDMFTSRSGFSSFYSPDWRNWGSNLVDMDHNQMQAVVRAYVLTQREGEPFMQKDEFDLLEHWRGNGGIDNCLFKKCDNELSRILNVAQYLRNREERKFRRI